MNIPAPSLAEVTAPAQWRVVDFISDLHLQASEPRTVQAWKHYLAHTQADAIFLLGDVFEVWVGDDALDEPAGDSAAEEAAFERDCIAALQASAKQGRALYFLHGNRDFLLGAQAAQRAGMSLLADPSVLVFGQAHGLPTRWLLSHGDALCLDDRDYQALRAQLRAPEWQQRFLAQPLAQRRAFARGLRAQSEARKQASATQGGHASETYADADPALTLAWLRTARAGTLIHGHTHQPADHRVEGEPGDDTQGPLTRIVLSDWHLDGANERAEVLRLSLAQGETEPRVQRLPLAEALATTHAR
ncbi:UDP-2,3-diacylglucosamine hydrolase [Hylemonella gracilis str. Niagara R]|uniref:UDP-2,3-diacylglucosamine hydrolase n=1 Tax=Hylemonella gracilis str. Niagara R TaxID=1458275 RepID=A0A016XGE3_9BURK|nr:UDP-2,3-diacylglucosamine diphosphatase [Hylemonella gracilis]EYC50916.1 UDP-2,3-diacylglucosamine hydrolase [Hylemonella gracilis str. Niagara R]